MHSDAELWQRVRQGDKEAFETLYRENASRLESFLRQATGNAQAAEDLMQDMFTRLWQQPNGFSPEQGTLRSYLYGIARKRAAQWWRIQYRQESVGDEQVGCAAETVSAINEALQMLPLEQRTLLWLREIEGQSYSDLAKVFEIPVGTVRSRLFAAREALRQIWRGR